MGSILVLAVLLTSAVPTLAKPADSDVRGPLCADMVDGAGFYDGTAVNFRIELATASCRQIAYTLFVLDESGASRVIASRQMRGDATSNQLLFLDVMVPANDDDTVCVYATTQPGRGRHVFDRAPDSGCAELVVDGPPAGQGFH
jgi:hypothetical protein